MGDGDQTSGSKPSDAPRFSAEHWAENADVLGVEGATYPAVIGALSAERRETHTQTQAAESVKRFLKREVVAEPAQPDPDPDQEG